VLRNRSLALALCSLVVLTLACGARYARVPLVETPDLVVALRSEQRDGAPIARGFAHPAAISVPRMESILSRIDVRESAGDADERRAALPAELLPTLASALAGALGRADPTQEVAVRAERRERKLGIFTRRFVTSFVAFVDAENRLQIHLVDADRELAAGDDAPQHDPVASRSTHAFKALPGPHVEALGQRAVAVDWRATLFEAPAVRDQPGRRRTILMESQQPARRDLEAGEVAPTADPDRLRALAELETARSSGAISEADYQRRRAALLEPGGD